MTYKIVKFDNYWKIYKLKEKKFINIKFKSRKTALNQIRNYIRYRHERIR